MRRLALAMALLGCAATTPAEAATMVNSNGKLTYTARGTAPISVSFDYGRTGSVSVIRQSTDLDPVTVTGCSIESASFTIYHCEGVTAVTVTGGSGDDFIWASGLDVPLTADGGDGDDQIDGGRAADSVSGGAGDDFLDGATGDTVGGGPGTDFASYTPPGAQVGPVSITLDGVADDGIDVLEGMTGDDTLLARDGLADRVRCGAGTDTALVDPLDQVSDTCEVVLVAGERPDDAPPRISWRPGSEIGVHAEDDRGVASVQWLDDDRVICTDTAAPFDCDFHPRIEDVGANTLTAIATDTAGQTASVWITRTIERFKPVTVALRVKRSGRRYVASGTVTLPGGVPCSGTVAVGKRTGKLTRACSFRIVVPRAAKYVAAYLGTDAIAPQRSKAVRPR